MHIAKPLKQKTQPEESENTESVGWEEITTNEVAYKLNPGDDITFVPLEEPKLVKQNQASVVHVKVLEWNTHPEFKGQEKLIMLQKIPTNVLLSNINNGKITIGKTIIKLINQGRQPGTRYYSYKIMVKQGE